MRDVPIWLHRSVGAGLAICLMEVLAHAAGEPLARVPFVTSIVLVLTLPEQPAARPFAVTAGHVLSAFAGYGALVVLGPTETASAVAVAVAVLLMAVTRSLHPPAGINAFLVPAHSLPAAWIASPVLAGALLLVAFSFMWQRLGALLLARIKVPAVEPVSRGHPGSES
ncbi:HPP family protein [Hyphomicrobium sp. CS1GBMeth3]|uniref:HPP family protein n=1 Tax=Hyphomicrobium sp. CS1GBMeth3 TaxID=1892845 RepID=UPI000930D2FE|nr:HPP family protein [Hyphomicrobium sp. CS1GBMeth3]